MTLPDGLDGLLPDAASVTADGHLALDGVDLVGLAAEFGTPLYVYDSATVRARARAYRDGLAAAYPGESLVCYAGKAYCAPWLLRVVHEEELGLDVVSGGELYAAQHVGFPAERIYVHGNNKAEHELAAALEAGVGRIVLDNLEEIETVNRLCAQRGMRQAVLLRVAPAVEAHTHVHIQTGVLDTKFGLSIQTGAAAAGVAAIRSCPALELLGLHAHIGSQVFELEPYAETISRLFTFARSVDLELRELSPGGGFGVRYTSQDVSMPPGASTRAVAGAVCQAAAAAGLDLPRLSIEPGRSIVGPAGVALYSVGSVKRIQGVRTYVAVDGGMADNIRPTAYGAVYAALLANRVLDAADASVAIAGRYCESGDVLVGEAALPMPRIGDLVAVPASGAYQLSMASNYNLVPRPAVVVVANGEARLVRRRETYADLLQADL
ncbi:MAG: diaminopimelate decarboxylase [Chloroflexi bacterium]|nr:diaminopimelate decarboxylase [Chloroflexota bacterium]